MKSYKFWMTVLETESGKKLMYKTTFVKPDSNGKGSLYVINNECHIRFTDRETIKNVFMNILKNGSCNGIPQEIGGVEDKTITSIVIDKNISDFENIINDANVVLSELLLMETPIEIHNIEAAKNVIKILKDFKTRVSAPHGGDEDTTGIVYYFDIYDPSYCMGYWTTMFKSNGNLFIDFVKMQGSGKSEGLAVAGSTINGINVGYIKPAPFSLGPIIFNPIGNEVVDLNSDGLIVNYIGMLRKDPKNFKEFRVYLTLNFKPSSIDGKYVGRSQETYDTFVRCIEDGTEQVKTSKEITLSDHQLPMILDYVKVEIQGDNPEKIKAIDIATIFNKSILLLQTCDLNSVSNAGDELINPNNVVIESDTSCKIKFTSDNVMYLTPIFVKDDLLKKD